MDRHRGVDVDVRALPSAMDDTVGIMLKNETGLRCGAGFLQFYRRIESHHIVRIIVLARLDDGLDRAADVNVAGEPSFALIAESHPRLIMLGSYFDVIG